MARCVRCGSMARQKRTLCRRCEQKSKFGTNPSRQEDRKLLQSIRAEASKYDEFVAGAFFNKTNPLRLNWMEGGRGLSIVLTHKERATCRQLDCGVTVTPEIRQQMKVCVMEMAHALEESRRLG